MGRLRPCLAEAVGTFALIFIGIGAIKAAGNDLLAVAFAHGLTIAVFASATMNISGGHLNPAVTFGALVGGKIRFGDAVLYWISQLLGATLAAYACGALLGMEAVAKGTPQLGAGVSLGQGIATEAILTFFLVFVVYGTGIDPRGPKIGGLAIGLTVALDILFGGPLTGAAMNPARTFGPALAAGVWDSHAVYWIGPLAGGGFAGWLYNTFLLKEA
jgi:MIP family channel proteins